MWAKGSSPRLLCEVLPEKLSCSLCSGNFGMSVGHCKYTMLIDMAFAFIYWFNMWSQVSVYELILWVKKILIFVFLCFLQENFLVLCPVHSSVKFPIEKSGHRSIRNRAAPLQLYDLILGLSKPVKIYWILVFDSF